MQISTVVNIMLYCPKCQKTYSEGTQRFCLNEGERLVPFAVGNPGSPTGGVFTKILKRKNGEISDVFSTPTNFPTAANKNLPRPDFHPITDSSVLKSDAEFELDLDLTPENSESKPVFSQILSLSGDPENPELELTSAEPIAIGNQKSDEKAEKISEQFGNAINQTIKDRYRLIEKIAENDHDATFLVEDETTAGKKVVLRFLNTAEDYLSDKSFTEESDALLKFSHPNIVNLINTGETPDGKRFLVSELVEGKTLAGVLQKDGQFNALRAARIVRQIADALSEAHQKNILHRNLTAENIILNIEDNGAERVRIKNFTGANEKPNEKNLPYKSPEQVEGKIAGPASDVYSLAVIAYQMLTNRLPFNAFAAGDLLKAQREGLKMRLSDVRFDLPPQLESILKKALAFYSFGRYLKARDFGDAFFSEVIANLPPDPGEISQAEPEKLSVAPVAKKYEIIKAIEPPVERVESAVTEALTDEAPPIKMPTVPLNKPIKMPTAKVKDKPETVKVTGNKSWESRSSELPNESNPRRNLLAFLGVAAVILALFAVWFYFINRPNEQTAATGETVSQAVSPIENAISGETNVNSAPTPEEIEAPPIPRQVTQPPNTSYFQNSKADLKGEAAKNYLGFSLYYPSGWILNNAGNNFLDVSKKAPNGLPVEQFLVSYYNSKGTFKLDSPDVFNAQTVNTNATLKKILPNYRMISEGDKTVNNGWQAREIKFEGTVKGESGQDLKIWGKRLFIPTAIRGMKNGYVITMLATSLSEDVKSVEDVGVKGQLSTILETFEPNQNF